MIYDSSSAPSGDDVSIYPNRKLIINNTANLTFQYDATGGQGYNYYKVILDQANKFDGNSYQIFAIADGDNQPFAISNLSDNSDAYISFESGLTDEVSTVVCHNSADNFITFGRAKYYVEQNDSEVNYKVRINKDSEDGAVIFTPDSTIAPRIEFVNNNTQLITYSIRDNADLWAQDWTDYYKYTSNRDGFKTNYNDGQITKYKWLNLSGYTGEYSPDTCEGKAWIEVPSSVVAGTVYYICLTTNTNRKILIQFTKNSAPVTTYTGTF